MIQIRELFDSPVPFRIIKQKKYQFTGYFKIGRIGYTLDIANDADDDDWYIILSSNTTLKRDFGKVGITGEGNASFVFSTVAKILEQFIKIYKPTNFEFTASEESRKKLYRVFSSIISKRFGYRLKINKGWNEEEYTFYRKK